MRTPIKLELDIKCLWWNITAKDMTDDLKQGTSLSLGTEVMEHSEEKEEGNQVLLQHQHH